MTTSQTKTSSRKSKQPITAHRLFPALVALWFAALLGLGSFAVPPQFLEKIVIATGLPALVPAATPPLGITARILVALALTVGGAALGLILGMRLRPRPEVAQRRRFNTGRAAAPVAASAVVEDPDAPRVRARDAHPDAPPRKPLVLSDDLVDQPVAEPAGEAFAPRRRALTMTDESLPIDPVESAPFPGFVPWEGEDHGFDNAPGHDLAQASGGAAFAPPAAVKEFAEPDVAEPVAAIAPPMPFARPAFLAATAPELLRSPVADAPLESLGLVQLIERLALAISERATSGHGVSREGEPADRVAPSPLPEIASPEATLPEPVVPEQPVIHREVAAERPERIVSLRPAVLAPEGRPASRFAPFAQHDDDDNHDDIVVPRFLGGTNALASFSPANALASPVTDTPEPVSPEPAVPEERYSSLLDISPHVPRQDFADADDAEGDDEGVASVEPVVIFPGQGPRIAAPFDQRSAHAPFARPLRAESGNPHQAFVPPATLLPDPEEADRALRAALATLQRMTAKG